MKLFIEICTFLCLYIKQYPQESLNISKCRKLSMIESFAILKFSLNFIFFIETYIQTSVIITTNELFFFTVNILKVLRIKFRDKNLC